MIGILSPELAIIALKQPALSEKPGQIYLWTSD